MIPTDEKTGLGESFPIHMTFTCGRWELVVVIEGRTYNAFGITADVALDNLANSIRKGKSDNDSTSD